MTSLERWLVGVLGIVALIMFFFPLSTTTAPIVGKRSYTGYDIVRHAEATSNLTKEISSAEMSNSENLPGVDLGNVRIPISIEFIYLIRVWIGIGFLGALLCIVGLLASRRLTGIAGAAGAAFAVLAIVHIKVANSDIHRMFSKLLDDMRDVHGDNPFAGLAELFVGGVNLTPGLGLYVMALSLGVTAILINTGVLKRVRLVAVVGNE